jgi:transposase
MPLPSGGWGRAPFVRLAQAGSSWTERAQAAVGQYGALLRRLSQIDDQKARGEIQDWLGRNDIPGNPAERARAVGEALSQGGAWTEARTKQVEDLETADREFEMLVSDAEKTKGTGNPQARTEPISEPGGGPLTPIGFALALAGILGLLVVPLAWPSDKRGH